MHLCTTYWIYGTTGVDREELNAKRREHKEEDEE